METQHDSNKHFNEDQYSQEYVSTYKNEFEQYFKYTFYKDDEHRANVTSNLLTQLDSESPISFIKQRFLPNNTKIDYAQETENYCGLNRSPLQIHGRANCSININKNSLHLTVLIVKNYSMKYPIILGRDFLRLNQMKLSSTNKTAYVEPNHCCLPIPNKIQVCLEIITKVSYIE